MKRRVANCEGQEEIFPVAEFDTGKPVTFPPLRRPLWTERKAALVARYLHYFVFVTKHGTYVDAFAGRQSERAQEGWTVEEVLKNEPARLCTFYLFEKSDRSAQELERLPETYPKRRLSGRQSGCRGSEWVVKRVLLVVMAASVLLAACGSSAHPTAQRAPNTSQSAPVRCLSDLCNAHSSGSSSESTSGAPVSTTTAPSTAAPPSTTSTTAAAPVVGGSLPCDSGVLTRALQAAQPVPPPTPAGDPVCIVVTVQRQPGGGSFPTRFAAEAFTVKNQEGSGVLHVTEVFEPNANGGVVWAPVGSGGAILCAPGGTGTLPPAVVKGFADVGVSACS